MNLVIDIGNTFVKYAVFDGNSHVKTFSPVYGLRKLSGAVRFSQYRITGAMVSCVIKENPQVKSFYSSLRRKTRLIIFHPLRTKIPLKNFYRSPETLGPDRLASAVGAAALYPGRNILVINAGTAITYDLITGDGAYRGGAISPGINMRFLALHRFTGRLPFVKFTGSTVKIPGKTTAESLRAGVISGTTEEARGMIALFRRQFGKELVVIGSGGDAPFLAKRLKMVNFVHTNLVLSGLNRILQYNIKYK